MDLALWEQLHSMNPETCSTQSRDPNHSLSPRPVINVHTYSVPGNSSLILQINLSIKCDKTPWVSGYLGPVEKGGGGDTVGGGA